MKTISTNMLISLIVILYISFALLVVVPSASNFLQVDSESFLVIKKFLVKEGTTDSLDKNESLKQTKVLGIDFEDFTKVVDVFSKILGTIFSFIGISWSIYIWSKGRKLHKIEQETKSPYYRR